VKAARTIGKGGRVETLIRGILDDMQLLATTFLDVTTARGKEQLAEAIEEASKMKPSLPDGFEEMPAYDQYGSGDQNINISIPARVIKTLVQANSILAPITSVCRSRIIACGIS